MMLIAGSCDICMFSHCTNLVLSMHVTIYELCCITCMVFFDKHGAIKYK